MYLGDLDSLACEVCTVGQIRVGFALPSRYLGDLETPARKVQTARSVSGRLCIAIKVPWRSYSLAPRVTKVHWRS